MGPRLLSLVTIIAIAAAGCVAPSAEETPLGRMTEPETPSGAENQWLLDAPRPFSTTVTNVSGGAEPMMLVSKDGNSLYIGDWTGVYRSRNNGVSWQRLSNPMIETLVIQDGFAIAEDDAGRIYIADTNGPIVGVASSSNGGDSWDVQSKIVEVGAIVDRPWLAARGDGDVVLITNTIRQGQREECARSKDGGQTWLDRSLANAATPNAGNVHFDSKGRIWFSDGESLWKWTSPCGNNRIPIQLPAQGPQILTQVAVDAQDRIYVAQPSADSNAMVLLGYPGSGSEFRTLAVSNPVLQANTFGAISVDNGQIAVAWYGSETEGNPSSATFPGVWNVFVARLSVADFWASETPAIVYDRITNDPNHVGGFCMGGTSCDTGNTPGDRDLLDYFGIDHAPNGVLHIAYGHDGATSNAQVRYARLN